MLFHDPLTVTQVECSVSCSVVGGHRGVADSLVEKRRGRYNIHVAYILQSMSINNKK